MVLTTQQIHELNKMSLTQLKTVHKSLKSHTKKVDKKEQLGTRILEIVQTLDKLRCDLSSKYKCTLKPRSEKDISNISASDLRQIHASFRQALQCPTYTKQHIIRSLGNLSRQVDYFMQY